MAEFLLMTRMRTRNLESESYLYEINIDIFPHVVLQGQENDIIIISLVRSNREKQIGFLAQSNRLCVAISRARCGLYLFGNKNQLETARVNPNLWKVGIFIFIFLLFQARPKFVWS